MKNMKTYMVGLLLIGITACQPKVITNLIKTYPVSVPPDSISMFEINDTVPNGAEALGHLSISDCGFSNKYKQAMTIACKETSRAGGNAFAIIKHNPLAIKKSGCYQITGLILYISDFSIYSDQYNSFTEVKELKTVQSGSEQKREGAFKNIISADIGYGIVTSKIYTLNKTYNVKGGLEWRLQYERTGKKYLGFSLQYTGFRTTFVTGEEILTTYLAPSIIYRIRMQKWIVKMGAGLGYFGCKADAGYGRENNSGMGINLDVGIEYMLSKHIGLGFSIDWIEGCFFKENFYMEPNEVSGLFRVNILGGIRFYF